LGAHLSSVQAGIPGVAQVSQAAGSPTSSRQAKVIGSADVSQRKIRWVCRVRRLTVVATALAWRSAVAAGVSRRIDLLGLLGPPPYGGGYGVAQVTL
jgi:hypothetical protein